MEQLTKDEAAKQLEEMEIRAKELRNIIAAPDIAIPIGTLGYVSSSDPDERYIVRLRRFSHMDDGYFYCWLDVSPDGETQPWEYFTPLPEAILPTMTKHDGGPYPGNENDFVLVTFRDGSQEAGRAGGWIAWCHADRSTDIVGFQVIKLGESEV